MSLITLRNYLREKKVVTLDQLTQQFKCDAGIMKNMLAHWQRKGRLCRIDQKSACGKTCQGCQPKIVEVYQYQDSI